MQAIQRKRVTQVGSGAYAIYLPKRWIDAWSPEQKARREVDLHTINNSILLVPAERRRRFEAEVPPDPDRVRMALLSAYVRGNHEATLRPLARSPKSPGAFDDACVALARDFLRHLDERLLTSIGPDRIHFAVQPTLPPPFASGQDLLALMATKLREMVALAADCVDAHARSPERARHAARLLGDLQEEDLARLYRQALRVVANLELPLGSVSDFQVLDLVAAELDTAGSACVAAAQAVLAGLEPKGKAPETPHPTVVAIHRAYARSLTEAGELVQRLDAELRGRDATALLGVAAAARAADAALAERLFATIAEAVGGTPLPPQAFAAYQVRHAVANLHLALGRAAERAASILAAQDRPPATPE